MHFIKKIIKGEEISEGEHGRFTRYGKGVYVGPVVSIKKRSSSIKIEGSLDYVDIVGEILLKNSKGRADYLGKIFSKDKDVSELLSSAGVEVISKKDRKGLYVYDVKGSLDSERLKKVYERIDGSYPPLLQLKATEGVLKVKKNLPKPGKVDSGFFTGLFSKLIMDDLLKYVVIVEDKNTIQFKKEIKISHTYEISEIITPEEYKNNYAKARKFAKRKGKMKRVVEIDKGIKKEEAVFDFTV